MEVLFFQMEILFFRRHKESLEVLDSIRQGDKIIDIKICDKI